MERVSEFGLRAWSPARVRALGVVTNLETAAEVLSIGRTKAYELARQGRFPVRVRRVDSSYLIAVADLLGYLNVPLEERLDCPGCARLDASDNDRPTNPEV